MRCQNMTWTWKRLRKHDLPTWYKLDILYRLSLFVDKVHAVFVHSDIKPSNVLLKLGAEGLCDRVILADFGVASVRPSIFGRVSSWFRRLGVVDSELAYPRFSLGLTPGFAAPEAASAKVATIEMDTYSFAVTAYKLLTGVLPHENDRYMLDSVTYSLRERAKEGFLPLSMGKVLTRALAEDPKRRYHSCVEMVMHLANAMHFQINPRILSVQKRYVHERK